MQDWELIAKYIKGETSKEEQAQVELWLKADSANAVLLEEIKATWQNSGKLDQTVKIDKAKAWSAIQEKIKEEQKVIPITRKRTVYNPWILRVAAILIVCLFATFLLFKFDSKPEMILVQTANEQKTIILPDSTSVVLNENSTLIYPKQLAANIRKVNLEGEAFFEVTKDQQRPFIIENKNFEVRVLGTSFNVAAYKKNKEAVVTVVTGKVSFDDRNGNLVYLNKGDMGVLNKTKGRIDKFINPDLNFMAWKTKKLEFTNTGFTDVCRTLKKYFSIDITVKNKNIFNCTFTGFFEDPKLEDVLKVLEKTLNIKTVVKQKNVEITGTGC